MIKTGIYKITSPSGKIYIGQAINIYNRWEKGYKYLSCKQQTKLYYSLKKYGSKNHLFEIVEECSEVLLNEREIYWGEFYNVLGENGLNCKLGNQNGRYSEETKKKMSENKLKLNKNDLKIIKDKYLNKDITPTKIGEEYNVTQCTIIRYLKKEKVFIENQVEHYLNSNLELIKKDYEKLSSNQIAIKHNISKNVILKFLKKHNIFIPLKNRVL